MRVFCEPSGASHRAKKFTRERRRGKPDHFVRELSPGRSSTAVHELLTEKSTFESSSCNTFTFLACVCPYTEFFIPNIRSWEERGRRLGVCAGPHSITGWVGEACSRSRMLPYCAFSAGMLFSFLRAVCPQKKGATITDQRFERRSAKRRATSVRRIAPRLMKGTKRICRYACAPPASFAHHMRFSSSTARSNACSQ